MCNFITVAIAIENNDAFAGSPKTPSRTIFLGVSKSMHMIRMLRQTVRLCFVHFFLHFSMFSFFAWTFQVSAAFECFAARAHGAII